MEERGVKLRLQLLVAVTLDDLRDFLLPPHVGRVVQVTFQALPSAHVDHRLTHEEPWEEEANVSFTRWLKRPCVNEVYSVFQNKSYAIRLWFVLQTIMYKLKNNTHLVNGTRFPDANHKI